MVNEGLVPDQETMHTLLCCLASQSHLRMVLSGIDKLVSNNDTLDSSMCNILINPDYWIRCWKKVGYLMLQLMDCWLGLLSIEIQMVKHLHRRIQCNIVLAKFSPRDWEIHDRVPTVDDGTVITKFLNYPGGKLAMMGYIKQCPNKFELVSTCPSDYLEFYFLGSMKRAERL
ncbi:uncharacterized protein LOC123208848 [Mangifera indica]|uniref:uncharacterized protein LOC123208848 n=1 Tax=Mangifera indica TaxID=29780 RepID=UPI001CFBF58A|nr:uncharacterized protein LOC123208848 [Mangifera indica]